MTTLHYIFDPFCGWCYAVAPLLEAARKVPGLAIELHGGGMMAGAQRRTITAQWRDYVLPHDQRIAQLSGQPFGAAYSEGLLRAIGTVLDSAPPTTAILAAQSLAGRGLDMLHALQRAHYVHGQSIVEPSVLAQAAQALGLEDTAFQAEYARLAGALTTQHFQQSVAYLDRIGGQGFPSFALARPDTPLHRIDIGPYLGEPQAWQDFLSQQTQAPAGATDAGPRCSLDGCTP